MQSLKSILLIEDDPGDARLLQEMLNEHDTHRSVLTHVECMSDAEEHLLHHPVDLILLDLGLPDAQGLAAVRRARAAAPRVPLVVLTGFDDDALSAQALQDGAQDYLIKGQIESRGLLRAMRYANERKRLEHLKEEFVSSVSHELRTPLTSISGSLGLLMANGGGDLTDRAMRLLTIAHANSQRLVRLVNDILDIEKMDSGCVVFNFARVEIRSLVERTIEANWGFAEARNVRLRLEDKSVAGEVRADSDRLVQVITNLLSNAIKFSPRDSEVVVVIENGADIICVKVRDHGPGIPDEFKHRIFERFAQADAKDDRRTGGTGLGLSIVKQIVERLGGEVGFVDAPGGGTVFFVELPCLQPLAGVAIDLDVQSSALRILLCEGDPDAATDLRKKLGQAGFATDLAYTAGDAIICALAAEYHAVLINRQLPDSDGVSLIRRLRGLTRYRDTPIVVISDDPVRERNDVTPSKLNVLEWLSKPVDFDRLMQAISKAPVDSPDVGLPMDYVGDGGGARAAPAEGR